MVITGAIIAGSCEPVEEISDIPEIRFKSLTGPFQIDTGSIPYYGATLKFSFTDGNSDFGTNETSDRADTNMYMVPFRKLNGTYDSIDATIYGRKYIVKNHDKLDRDGEPIKGEISVDIPYFLLPPFDTLRYEFYIIDRAGNKSNVETTSDIAF